MSSTVILAMSGGVDSSASAAILTDAGWKVIGITLVMCQYPETSSKFKDLQDARAVAEKLGFEHRTIEVKEQFRRLIIDNFLSEYQRARTPNPCVRCNPNIKWATLIGLLQELKADFVATGHYAKVNYCEDGAALFRARNLKKDQSYALWALPREYLQLTIFPLGDMDKDEARQIADKLGLNLSGKRESQEICFIPEGNYADYLLNLGVNSPPGDILDDQGKVIGKHLGLIHYTLGQRKGLVSGLPEPLFVYRIDPETNRIFAGPRSKSVFHYIEIENVNWLGPPALEREFPALVKVRYKDIGRQALVTAINLKQMKIYFPDGADAPTPGQSAVIYQDDRVLAGGIIEKVSS